MPKLFWILAFLEFGSGEVENKIEYDLKHEHSCGSNLKGFYVISMLVTLLLLERLSTGHKIAWEKVHT